jgi:hypothetical protein
MFMRSQHYNMDVFIVPADDLRIFNGGRGDFWNESPFEYNNCRDDWCAAVDGNILVQVLIIKK